MLRSVSVKVIRSGPRGRTVSQRSTFGRLPRSAGPVTTANTARPSVPAHYHVLNASPRALTASTMPNIREEDHPRHHRQRDMSPWQLLVGLSITNSTRIAVLHRLLLSQEAK